MKLTKLFEERISNDEAYAIFVANLQKYPFISITRNDLHVSQTAFVKDLPISITQEQLDTLAKLTSDTFTGKTRFNTPNTKVLNNNYNQRDLYQMTIGSRWTVESDDLEPLSWKELSDLVINTTWFDDNDNDDNDFKN